MSVKIECPDCKRPWILDEASGGGEFICPSCLARISLPDAVPVGATAQVGTPPAATPTATTPEPPRPTATVRAEAVPLSPALLSCRSLSFVCHSRGQTVSQFGSLVS